jgi:hypothetical protein
MLKSLRELPDEKSEYMLQTYEKKFPKAKSIGMSLTKDGNIKVHSNFGSMLFNENGEELV